MKKALLLILAASLVGCSSAPEPAPAPAKPAAPAEPAHVSDHTSLFPPAGRTSAKVVPDHLLDMKAMPGGSLAEYEIKGKKYQMFIIDAESNQKAAFLMLDMKGEMKNPEYLAHMGGYYGTYGDQPLYTFAKLHFVAGIVGLPRDKADPIAIKLAAQLD